MPLKSLNNHPPGSFQVYVPETDWRSTPYTGFSATVEEVQQHRKLNPRFGWPTDTASVAKWVEEYTVARLRTVPGGTDYIVEGSAEPPANFPLPHRRQRRAVGAVEGVKVKKLVAGISLITDWLGDSLAPVEQVVADHRASICARCPLNRSPNAVQGVYGIVGDGLHLLMEAKNDMQLATPHDNVLQTCSACDCKLTLKVWTPTEHIKKHTSEAVFNDLDPGCWIRAELKST